jgi:hypothetical protein
VGSYACRVLNSLKLVQMTKVGIPNPALSICPRKLLFNMYIGYLLYVLVMTAAPGSYRCMACGLVFDSEDEAKRHEDQHPGMVRKATGETAPS